MASQSNDDLPLLSNVRDIRARHYILFAIPSFISKTFTAKLIVIFSLPTECEKILKICSNNCKCKSTDLPCKSSTNKVVLDMDNLNVMSVSKIESNSDVLKDFINSGNSECPEKALELGKYNRSPLEYKSMSNSLEIYSNNFNQNTPLALEINYQTSAEGKSMVWSCTADGNPCVFTAGSLNNNRSLLPCQDSPGAMATWQAFIILKDENKHVSMTGDESSSILPDSMVRYFEDDFEHLCYYGKYDNFKIREVHYFKTDMLLPIATMALAIGSWNLQEVMYSDYLKREFNCNNHSIVCDHVPYSCFIKKQSLDYAANHPIPLTMVYEETVEDKLHPLIKFLPYCVIASVNLFGYFPCPRLEIVILPNSFASLGLASPNVIYLNTSSAVAGDSFTYLRMCHEIAHNWFGIIIGPEDWTEEWLSEGFATYAEEVIYETALKLYINDSATESYRSYKVRKVEDVTEVANATSLRDVESVVNNENVWTNLKDLRDRIKYQNLKQEIENSSDKLVLLKPDSGSKIDCVQDGLKVDKIFRKVHYLKGYFLLEYLSKSVGKESFVSMLRNFVKTYHGRFISSDDFLTFMYNFSFKNIKMSKNDLVSKWLHSSDLEDCIFIFIENNILISESSNFIEKFKKSKTKKNLTGININFKGWEQIHLLLEKLLELENTLKKYEIEFLFKLCKIEESNCEVRHSWCELLIKNNHKQGEKFVRKFLTTEFAMGVYLYGELMISNRKQWSKLAREIYQTTQGELDEDTRRYIQEMILPS